MSMEDLRHIVDLPEYSEKVFQPEKPVSDFYREIPLWNGEPQAPVGKLRSQNLVVLPEGLVTLIDRDLDKEISFLVSFGLYAEKRISASKAANLNGMNYEEFLAELRSRGLRLPIGPESIQEAEQEYQRFLERE